MTATPEALEATQVAAAAAVDKQATDPVAFDVSDRLAITDVFLIASASNERQVGAIVDAIEEKLREIDRKPARREGDRENRWVLLDYVDLVVHVMHAEERAEYSLERLWRDCPTIELDAVDAEAARIDETSPEHLGLEQMSTDLGPPDQASSVQPTVPAANEPEAD